MTPNQDLIEILQNLIKSGAPKDYLSVFKHHHEADIADVLEELPFKDRHQFFLKVKPELAAEVLEEMNLPQQIQFISELKSNLAAKFIEEMEPDDAADLLEELQETDIEKAEEIIDALPQKEAQEIKELLSYEENSAGAIMTNEYVAIPENLTIKQAIETIKKQNPPDSEISFYIFIIDKYNKLIGYTTLRNILLANPENKIKSIRNDYPIKTYVDSDQEKVAQLIQKYDLIAVPVLNHQDELVGLITIDDIVDVVVEEATEDLYKLSGTSEIDESKLISGKLRHALLARSPWLAITIFGGILASYLITTYSALYDAKLFPLALSLSFIPLLMGLGGNAGNQSATIIVRGIATGQIKEFRAIRYIFRETLIGLLMGSIIASVLFMFNVFISNYSLLFSSVVSISLLCNITLATIIGSSLPLVFKKINIDPAVASAPFISTILDIIGQLIYFTLTLWAIHTLV